MWPVRQKCCATCCLFLLQVLAEIEGSNEAFEQAEACSFSSLASMAPSWKLQAALKDLQKAYDKALAKAQKQIAEVVYSFSA